MEVALTPELEQLVQAKLATGRYRSASEVIGVALRLLDQQESIGPDRVKELRARIDIGLAGLDRGEGIDGEPFMQSLLDDLDSRPAKSSEG